MDNENWFEDCDTVTADPDETVEQDDLDDDLLNDLEELESDLDQLDDDDEWDGDLLDDRDDDF